MASLLSWAKKNASKAYDQANPLDNGRTFQQRTPTNNRSLVGQASHSGVSNFVGSNIVKPLVRAPLNIYSTIANPIYNHAVAPVFHLPTQTPQEVFQSNPVLKKFNAPLGATGSLHQTVSDTAQLGLTAATGPLGNLAEKAGAGVVGFVAPKLATRAAVLTSKGLSSKAIPKAVQFALKANASGAIGAGFNASAAAGQGAKPVEIAKSGGIGYGLGVGLPVAGAIAKPVVKAGQSLKPLDQAGGIRNIFQGGQNLHYSSGNGSTKISGKANAVRAQLLKLNEVGAVGKNIDAEAIQYAHTFGISKEQAVKDLANLNKAQSIEAAKQMRKPQGVGVSKGIKDQLNPKAQFKRGKVNNTNLNPLKVDLPEVRPGEYGQARLKPQAASKPIEFSASQTVKSVKKLNKTEKAAFWKAVENPEMATSPKLKDAVQRWNDLSNRVHATSQALGGNTNYVSQYARHNWDLTDPKMAAKYEDLVNSRGGAAVDPYDFSGVNSQNRAFSSITEGEAAGFKLKNPSNPEKDIIDYANSASGTLKKQALAKAFTEADMKQPLKNRSFDLGNGQTIPLSEEGIKRIKAYEQHNPSTNKAIRGARTVNQAIKTSILSGGQFHPINIAALRAGPSIAMAGHPVRAAVGVARTFRPLLPGGKGAVDRVMEKALKDGMVEKAAKIGAPYGQAGYNVEGTALKSGVGHKMVFERQMPMMHDQVIRSVIKDLEKKNIPLDSEAARQAGIAANSTMGFINKEALNISPKVRQGMSDLMLASQFTPSKIMTVSKVGKSGVAGKYARSDVVSNVVAATTLITGLGYVLGQKSDSIRDSLLRALVNPAIPTPMKDKKGNNIEFRIPTTYTAEIAKILGLKVERQGDGHLGVAWKPTEALSAHGGLTEWMRSRLSPGLSTGVKLASNTNFAEKPLYDPNAQSGQKAIQAGTVIGQGFLPIGAQGLPNTKIVKDRLPGSSKEILDANTPGSNPLLKSGASSFGFSPRADQTVGKGLDSSRYFGALNEAKKGLNSHEKATLELYAGNKKNPVTGKYDVQPNVHDTSAKAKALLDQPKVIDKLISMNSKLGSLGSKVDPLWATSKDQITKVLEYQSMPPGGPDKTHWYNKNKDWYEALSDKRTTFFNSLPKGDPNKPSAPIEFPKPSANVASKQSEFFSIQDGKQRSAFLRDNPEVQTQLDKQVEYNNKMRAAQGYGELDTFPKADARTQKIIDFYNTLPKNDGPKGGSKTRSLWIQSHPNEYAAMSRYFTQASLYGLEKDAGQAMFKDTGFSQSGLKDITSVAKNIGTSKDDNGNTFYALGGDSSSGKYGYSARTKKPPKFTVGKIAAAKRISRPKGVKVSKVAYKAPKTRKLAVSRIPKIS